MRMIIIGKKLWNEKKILMIVTKHLFGSGSTITTFTLSIFIPSVGVILSSGTALITSIAILININ